jgi:hypothetical protein
MASDVQVTPGRAMIRASPQHATSSVKPSDFLKAAASRPIMSDRKYRQRGYQDEPRDREPSAPKPQKSRDPRERPEGPKTPNLMASHEVFRCSRCGNRLGLPVDSDSRCSRCGVDLHSCIQCVSFDTSARFECTQPLTTRVAPKDGRNACPFFAARTTVERQTSTAGPTSARQAFDDLFK